MPSPHEQSNREVRQVVLPSGRTIEVVSFAAPAVSAPPAIEIALHICVACGSDLVQPVDCEPAAGGLWDVTMRCPECETVLEDTVGKETLELLDEALDEATRLLADDLRALEQANFESAIECFVGALAADAILPIDF